jgi:hypothetical protein
MRILGVALKHSFIVGFEDFRTLAMISSILCNITPFSLFKVKEVSEENVASIFKVE